MNKSRTYFLDLLRIAACFLVIVNHTNSVIFLSTTPEHIRWFISITYFFISKIAVPVFFMISGYLLLNKVDNWSKTLIRVLRMVVVLFACAVVYSLYKELFLNDSFSAQSLINNILSAYKNSPTNALWYLYTYIGILLMLPFLQKLACAMNKKDYHVFFIISGFFISVFPILQHYIKGLSLNSNFFIPIFSGYICVLFVGQYFSRFGVAKSKSGFFIAALTFVVTVSFNVIATYFEYQKSNTGYLFYDNRNFLPIILGAACVFYMASFLKVTANFGKVVSYIGSCTFGIYLISDLFINILKPHYYTLATLIHPLVAVLIFEICVFISGFALTAMLRLIPVVKKYL